MKFGFHTESWGWLTITPKSFPTVLDQIHEAGFKGFETHDIDVLPYFNQEKNFLQMISEREMQLASLHIFGEFYTPYKGIHPRIWLRRASWRSRHIPRVAKFASSVGCKRLVFIGGIIRDEEHPEKDIAGVAKMMNGLGKICNEFGIEASYHHHSKYVVARKNQLDMLCELLDPDLVHLTVDTGQWVAAGGTESELIDAMKTYSNMIDHVHFRDFKDGEFVEVGEGIVNLPKIANLLKSMDYRDWIIIEHDWKILERASTTPTQSLMKARKYVDTYLANI